MLSVSPLSLGEVSSPVCCTDLWSGPRWPSTPPTIKPRVSRRRLRSSTSSWSATPHPLVVLQLLRVGSTASHTGALLPRRPPVRQISSSPPQRAPVVIQVSAARQHAILASCPRDFMLLRRRYPATTLAILSASLHLGRLLAAEWRHLLTHPLSGLGATSAAAPSILTDLLAPMSEHPALSWMTC